MVASGLAFIGAVVQVIRSWLGLVKRVSTGDPSLGLLVLSRTSGLHRRQRLLAEVFIMDTLMMQIKGRLVLTISSK